MQAKARLYLTADRDALVPAGHAQAASLYCVPGDTIPDSAAQRFGLVDGDLKRAKGAKEDKGGGNKEQGPGENKEGNGGGNKGEPPVDDLTKLKGVGAATSKALVAGGMSSFAAIAAIDPASPPVIEGLSPAFDWAKVKAAAAEALAAS